MNQVCAFIVLLLAVQAISSKGYSQNTPPSLEGPYLGQKLPGSTPKVFAPDIVSTEHRDLSGFFTPDMNDFYFTRKDNKSGKWWLVAFKSENNRWHESLVGPRLGRPFISPDGKTMHLGQRYRTRTNTGWSEIKSLGAPYEAIRIMRLTASLKETYVFDEATRDGNGVIRYSRLVGGKREEPRPFGKEINSGKWNAHPFIAPDESYIIWDGERGNGFGSSDIYISFLKRDGSWGAAINLGGKINTDAEETGGYVTPDGKFIFFNRHVNPGNGDIYWVDAQIIETLRPKL